jgi:hypothetical protein
MPTPDGGRLTQAVLKQLAAEIAAHDYTAASLARALDRDPNTFRRWMRGEREMPLPVLAAILSHLDLDPAEFMTRARARVR